MRALPNTPSGTRCSWLTQPCYTVHERPLARNWGQEGVINVNDAMAELTILTASSCLMGEEIRKRLSAEGAHRRSLLHPPPAKS